MGIIQLPAEQWAESAPAAFGKYIIRIALSEEDGLVRGIEDVIDHEPTQSDYDELMSKWVSERKRMRKAEVNIYDTSSAVNGFSLNGNQVWLDKATRVGLVNLLNQQKNAGEENTTLWLNGTSLYLPIDTALGMLCQLEVYAGKCYNQTEAHKVAINALETVEEVEAYDITAGYPEQLSFTI